VFYWGKKYGQDKDAFFRNADIFVFPTYYPNECFPLVLLEAMQQGLPCISTMEGGITSIIDDGKTGLLVNRQDADDLADKIAWMIEHPKERIDMGVEGYRKIESMFIISQFEENLATILEDNGKERNEY
jgi:glycosyltransferase involved in cell wall biosynthesis